MVRGVECVQVREFSAEISHLREINPQPGRGEHNAPACWLCPHNGKGCDGECGFAAIFIEARYLPILIMRGAIDNED